MNVYYLKNYINKYISQSYLSGSDEEPRFFTIASFNKYTNEALNWLKIFNSQLTVESQLTEDSKVMIEKPDLLLKLLDLIKDTPKE